MAGVSFKSNRAYPSIPSITGEVSSHTEALLAMKEAIEIHERRTANYLDSFVRLHELVDLGLITLKGDRFNVLGPEVTDNTLASLLDVSLEETVFSGEVLQYDAADEKWENRSLAEAGISAVGHTHDDRYYTETEIDAILTAYYTAAQVDSLLAGKSDVGHTHTEADITDLDHYTDADANLAIDARVTKAFVDALNVDADTLDGIDSTGFSLSGHTHTAAGIDSGAAADGFVLTADGAGAAAWEAPSGGSSLPADPNVDAILFWDDAGGTAEWITELPDSFLSNNVPLLNAANKFTNFQEITRTSPQLYFEETDAGTDEKRWRLQAQGDVWAIDLMTDANSFAERAFSIARSSTNATTLALAADAITANGSEVLTEATGAQLAASNTFTGENIFIATQHVNAQLNLGNNQLITWDDTGAVARALIKFDNTDDFVVGHVSFDTEILGLTVALNAAKINLNGAIDASGDLTLSKSNPSLFFKNTSAGTDETLWKVIASVGDLFIQAPLDNGTTSATAMRFVRTTNAVDRIVATATEFEVNGVLQVNGTQDFNGAADFASTITAAGDILLTGTRAVDATTRLNLTGATVSVGESGGDLGFYGAGGVTKRIVSGATDGNEALQNLLASLALMGLIINSTT